MFSIFATLGYKTIKFYFRVENKVIIIVEYLEIALALFID